MRVNHKAVATAFLVMIGLFIPMQVMAALPGARSATDGTQHDVFLGGNYIELGLNRSGSFGSTANKPANFYGTTARTKVGMSVDFDGFDTATDYRMDYFMPGTPYESWVAGYKIAGTAYTGANALATSVEQITGNTVTDTSSGSTLSATSVGTLNSKLEITQRISFGVNDKFFKNEITLKNVGASSIDSVRYMRIFDPDNTRDQGGSFTTFNKVLYTYATDGKAVVQSDTSNNNSDPVYLALGTRAPILYYSSDSRARVNNNGNTNIYSSAAYDSSPAKDTSNTGDNYISITFDVGTLAPNASETVSYYMSLDDRDFSEVLEDIQEDEAPDPTPTPTAAVSASGPATTWTDTDGDRFTFEGSLLENLYTEDTLPPFVFTQARDSTYGIAKYQIIVSGPEYPSRVYFDNIAPTAISKFVETSERTTEYLNDINRISVRSKREEDRLPKGEYKWKIRAFNTQGVTVDSPEKVLRISSYQAVFTNTTFPLTLLQAGNITDLDISSIHPDPSMKPLTVTDRTPTFYGIANVNSHVKIILKDAPLHVYGEYRTDANTESRFGINIDTPLPTGSYTVQVSATNDSNDFVELPSFTMVIKITYIEGSQFGYPQ